MAYKIAGAGFIAALFVMLTPADASACPICFGGDPDSQLAQSVNWAVFALLGVTGGVLSGFVGFIFHLIKRSRMALGQSHDHYQGDRFDG
jgi:hypothetical protein